MGINLALPKSVDIKPRIVVIGVGGAGGNAVNNMITSGLGGVEFVVANTDAQALAFSAADRRVQMGTGITRGLGAGMKPEIGEESAEDSMTEILEHLDGAHMLFVAAGMGGGTGTGAAPVIARAAREKGILTVAIVTKPFQFEGSRRMAIAEEGIERLTSAVDTLIVIPNQNLFRIATEQTTMTDAFAMADEVLNSGVRGITDLMVVPGLINLDFNDVRTIMDEMGKAMMGTGEATGERRAVEAAEGAISNPLLDDVSLKGARGVLINITGGKDLTLYEVDEAASLIRSQVDQDANIIVGSALDPDLDGIVRVSVVATGVGAEAGAMPVAQSSLDNNISRLKASSASLRATREPVAVIGEDDIPALDKIEAESEPAYMAQARPAEREASVSAPEATIAPPPMPRAAVTAPAPAPAPAQPQPQTIVKRPFGFFGRKKSIPVAATPPERPRVQNTGDLFGEDENDELEIPAFLRRQSH
ncbi:MAG: cell division protein FtsZ [Hellea sp.]|nr:cell division protein FtsZ [Hellea sp.]